MRTTMAIILLMATFVGGYLVGRTPENLDVMAWAWEKIDGALPELPDLPNLPDLPKVQNASNVSLERTTEPAARNQPVFIEVNGQVLQVGGVPS